MSVSLIPIVVAIIGALLYFLSPNAKASEVGRILLFAGALAALMQGGHSCTLK